MSGHHVSFTAESATAIAGVSAPAFRKAHAQRLLLFAISVLLSTFVAWEVMMSSWTTQAGPRGILRDSASIMVAAACHGMAAFSRYVTFDVASPTTPRKPSLASFFLHGVLGQAISFCAWDVLSARAGYGRVSNVSEGLRTVGILMVNGNFSSFWYFFSFEFSKHHVPFGLPGGMTLSTLLRGQICSALESSFSPALEFSSFGMISLLCFDLVASNILGNLWLFLLLLFFVFLQSPLSPLSPVRFIQLMRLGGLLYVLRMLQTGGGGSGAVETTAGPLAMVYLHFLITFVSCALHSFLSGIMHAILTAPQDFVLLWTAGEAASSYTSDTLGPSSPAVMLFDALSVGHLTALDMAERDFLQDRAGSGSGAYGVFGGSTYKRGSIGDWEEEVELQRRALTLTAMARAGGVAARSAGEGLGIVPPWAKAARLQALQSLALKAPRSRELREALYKINIAPVLRTLCLELDVTTLTLQALAFQADPAGTPHALALEGRADVKWLVYRGGTAAASRDAAGGRCMQSLKDGFTPPFKGTLGKVLSMEWPARLRLRLRCGQHEEEARERPQLSEIRVQSAVWAAKSVSVLMVFAPGESRVWSLDPMLPVVLGSLAGLLLAVQTLEGVHGSGNEGHQSQGAERSSDAQMKKLAQDIKIALSEVATKYRSCLPSLRFPLAYADTINRVCS